jgi:hypothetical protein
MEMKEGKDVIDGPAKYIDGSQNMLEENKTGE